MTDDRALTWTTLLAADAGYTWVGVPTAFGDLLDSAGFRRGEDVLCIWAPVAADLATIDIDRFSALALVNPRQVSTRALWDSDFRHVRRYAVVPSLADARWFVPRDNVSAAAATLGRYVPYRRMAHLAKVAATIAVRIGLPFWYRDELVIAARAPFPLERVLAAPFGNADIRLAFSSGTPGPARKTVIQVLRPNGDLLGYAKLGVTATTARLVRKEARLLRSLGGDSRTASCVPRLLFEDEVCGMPVAVQSPVDGRRGPIEATSAHDRFLALLQSQQRRPVAESCMFRNIGRRVAALTDRPPVLRIALDGVRPIFEELSLPSTIVHGDFAPWNLRMQGKDVRAFDWEYGELDGNPLADELHHALQVGCLLRGWSVDRALDYLESVQAAKCLGLQAEEIAALQVLYLLDVCSRRIEEGHSPDEAENRRYLWLISALNSTYGVQWVRS